MVYGIYLCIYLLAYYGFPIQKWETVSTDWETSKQYTFFIANILIYTYVFDTWKSNNYILNVLRNIYNICALKLRCIR